MERTETPPPLPKRQKKTVFYNISFFSELLKKGEKYITMNSHYALFIDDFTLLKDNTDFFLKIINSKKYEKFIAKDFSTLQYIESIIPDKSNIFLELLDDFQNKDRSYINAKAFVKTELILPITYILWNPTLNDIQKISSIYNKTSFGGFAPFGADFITKEEVKIINEIAANLGFKWQDLSDLDKLILLSSYLQNRVQYVDENNVSYASTGTYITSSGAINPTLKMVNNPINVILNKYGICGGIANATTLLLNNCYVNINAHTLLGESHFWNLVKIEDKYYFHDNTWAITRNKNRYPESLKAHSFSQDYLLFGQETAKSIGHHNPSCYFPQSIKEDYPPLIIDEHVKKLSKTFKFTNYDEPVFPSHLKRD